ncbi:MAG: DUF2491 family protein [Alphaproteobacteria bacterium]|nr:DUF2491 family protein [Alphaproteobacteria bacterium]
MRDPSLRRRLRLLLVYLAIAAGAQSGGSVAPWLAPLSGIWAVSSPAAAQTSGGYTRPGGYGGFSGLGRRPAIGNGGLGGLSGSPFGGGFGLDYSRGGDRAISRQSASQALRDYRAAQTRSAPTALPSTRRPSVGWDNDSWGTAPLPRRHPATGWGGGAYAPGYAGRPGLGAFDAILGWSLLNSLSRPQSVSYFQDYRDDPRYADWRAEADRKAQSDPAVAQKLAELDKLMAQGHPARPRTAPPDEDGSGLVFFVFAGSALFIGLWMLRRRAAAVAGPTGTTARGRFGGPVPWGLSGSESSRFRVGMTFPVDPSPFLLAAGVTKVKPPEAGAMVSVEAVGMLTDRAVVLHRLYLPGRQSFFMLHLGANGTPDECRYFSLLDQVTPASQDEWGFWLDPAQGMIGWPQFQTKDGKLYDRIWAPGSARVPPRQQLETVQDVNGEIERKLEAMLYAAHTGAAPPAPATEYVLVCAVERADEAWIEVYAGIDINSAMLTLPAVPLSC